ncbi:MAG TPA: gamma-glutamylcyclotransferase family protein [Stellaceae bacterium]|nr:gamma-glutamylcyclotransferase family protein [Stellaceae bacterium]
MRTAPPSDPAARKRCFAYGANMIAADMAARCPAAREIGTVILPGWRFAIMGRGYATILPEAGAAVHGVLWWITPDCERILDQFENVAGGLYHRETLTVAAAPALVYLGNGPATGRPRAGYLEPIVAAAEARGFPPAYVAELRRWLNPA